VKYCELKEVITFLQTFSYIKLIKRVENNTVKIVFSKEIIYFDLTKSNSIIYTKTSSANLKEFNAPFDKLLSLKFTNSKIKKISLLNNDKILEFEVYSASKYKKEISKIIFEFTGKHTNIIVTDENYKILEALHHIDKEKSSRAIKIGLTYELPPKPNFKFSECKIKDIKSFLEQNYKRLNEKLLNNIKKVRLNQIEKEISKIKKLLNLLDSQEELLKKSNEFYEKGNLLLANIHLIKPYQSKVILNDFNSNKIEIKLDTKKSINQYINELYKRAKKYKQKAKNQIIEEQNLKEKLFFYENLYKIIGSADEIETIEFYFPKKEKNKTKTKKEKPFAEFFYNGFIIRVGRNERENIYLLQNSKASDFWFHLQGQKSAHLIVLNSKKELPKDVIIKAGEILANFSGVSGSVTVDYTQRRFIKIQNKANVLYNPYKSITIRV